jgi:hypothetical protein
MVAAIIVEFVTFVAFVKSMNFHYPITITVTITTNILEAKIKTKCLLIDSQLKVSSMVSQKMTLDKFRNLIQAKLLSHCLGTSF